MGTINLAGKVYAEVLVDQDVFDTFLKEHDYPVLCVIKADMVSEKNIDKIKSKIEGKA